MGESELYEPVERRREKRKSVLKRLTIVNAIFIIAIIALAGISVSLFSLANDYHDAKYKAQYVLADTLIDSMTAAQPNIRDMIDSSNPGSSRLAQSAYADANLKEARACAYAISVMYPDGSKESVTFQSVERAIDQTEYVVYSYNALLYSRFIYNNSLWESNSTINSMYLSVTDQMTSLADLLSAGMDSSRDWQSSPYSLLKRMDLEAIAQASGQLEATGVVLHSILP